MSTSPMPPSPPLPAPLSWTGGRRVLLAAQGLVALALLAVLVSPPMATLSEQNVRVHHLAHAGLLLGGGMLGLLASMVAQPAGRYLEGRRRPALRVVALSVLLLVPVLVMAAMIPAASDWIEAHPLVHALEHGVLIVVGGVIGFTGRLFSTAVGWLSAILMAAMACAFAGMVLAHPLSLPSALPGPTQPPAAASTRGAGAQAAAGDTAAGRAAFLSSGCVGCHALASAGATGVVGPALNHVGQIRTLQWLVVQMHDPCASGHQLAGYSCQMMVGAVAGLTEQQRRDIAAFLAAQK